MNKINPDYYKGKVEAIDYMRQVLTPEEYKGYLKGCAFKYLVRAGKKECEATDIQKAQWYICKLVEAVK
jgi:hypothetical protein